MDLVRTIAILGGAGLSGWITTVAGLGGGILFLPLLIWAFDSPIDAVVVLSTAMLWGNIVRFVMFRAHTDWDVIKAIMPGCIPGAALGALLLARAPEVLLTRLIAGYLLAYVAYEVFLSDKLRFTTRLSHFPLVGFVTGLLSGMFGAAGPLTAPFFVNYGLTKDRFLATNMLTAMSINAIKAVVYTQSGNLEPALWGWSLGCGAMVTLGIGIGRAHLERIDEALFKKCLLAMLTLVAAKFLIG